MIKDLSELDKLLKLCRKRGVTDLKLGDIELKLGALPERKGQETHDESDEPEMPDALSPDEMIFFSAGGNPA